MQNEIWKDIPGHEENYQTSNFKKVPPGAKLTIIKVKRIKEFLWAKISQGDLAKQFKINKTAISRITTGKRWAWV